ncbi:hypothetical protein ONZ45_g5490 [Pleurotus djamor]|nr:hypothetical protein ONZ45_g5490 [Pleurotus djamor]
MDERALNEIGVAPLLKVVRSIHDRFSGTFRGHLFEELSSQDTLRGLTDALSYLHSIGIGGLFSFDVEGDVGVDPNFMTLWFNQPRFGLPSMEYYKERHVTTVYQDVIENLLSALTEQEVVPSRKASFLTNSDAVLPYWPWKPPGKLPKSTKQLAQSVVEFETQLANASLNYDLDDILYHDPRAKYNPMPLTDLINAIPQVNLKDYLSAFLPHVIPPKVIVTHPAYLKALSGILNSTSASTVEAYLITRAALELSPYLGTETKAWKSQRRLLELLSGLKEGVADDRSQYCTTTVESALGFATGRYFVNQTFSEDSREQAMNVVTNIVEAFKLSLNNIDWMDSTSAQAAAEKASVIRTRVKVGYPFSPDTRDPMSLIQYYSLVDILSTNFFGNMLNASASEENKKWAKLGKMRDMEAWEMMFPSTADAFFRAPANKIVLPAGILQPPFFSSHWPAYMYYGAFGFIAAHELTHAFDSAGRMYNQQGRLKEWWTNETSDGFQAKQDCVFKQYSAYTIDDGRGGQMHINGNLTSGENIGDSGLIQSYRAWKAQYPESLNSGKEKLLPGLNYTREQLFFISFARIWARTMNTATAIEHLRTDPHSPPRYRVEGTVSNIPEFAKAFNCSAKAKLNPHRRKQCIFWGSD